MQGFSNTHLNTITRMFNLIYVLVSKSFRDLLIRIEGTITEKREWNDSIFVPKGSSKRILICYINIPVSRQVDSGVNDFI